MLTTGLRSLAWACLPLLAAQPVLACFICDEIVEFDPMTAQCFLENVPTYLSKAETDSAQRVEVNLTACSPSRSIDSFPSFKRSVENGDGKVAMIYTLEASSVSCLAEKLASTEVTDVVSFAVSEACILE